MDAVEGAGAGSARLTSRGVGRDHSTKSCTEVTPLAPKMARILNASPSSSALNGIAQWAGRIDEFAPDHEGGRRVDADHRSDVEGAYRLLGDARP